MTYPDVMADQSDAGGKFVAIAGAFVEPDPEPSEIMAQYNIWEGLYEGGLSGQLVLKAMAVQVSKQNEVVITGDGVFPGLLVVSQTAHPTERTRQMELVQVTLPSTRFSFRGRHMKREVAYEIPQDGSNGKHHTIGGLYSNRGKLVGLRTEAHRPVSQDDLILLTGLYKLIEHRRQEALKDRNRKLLDPVKTRRPLFGN